jgi:hypothetical protein
MKVVRADEGAPDHPSRVTLDSVTKLDPKPLNALRAHRDEGRTVTLEFECPPAPEEALRDLLRFLYSSSVLLSGRLKGLAERGLESLGVSSSGDLELPDDDEVVAALDAEDDVEVVAGPPTISYRTVQGLLHRAYDALGGMHTDDPTYKLIDDLSQALKLLADLFLDEDGEVGPSPTTVKSDVEGEATARRIFGDKVVDNLLRRRKPGMRAQFVTADGHPLATAYVAGYDGRAIDDDPNNLELEEWVAK